MRWVEKNSFVIQWPLYYHPIVQLLLYCSTVYTVDAYTGALHTCTLVHVGKTGEKKKATSQNQYPLHSLFGLGSLLPLLNTHPTVTRNPANPFPLPTDGTSCWDLLPSVGAANDATVVGLFLFLFGFFLCSCVCHRWLLTGWFRFLSNDKNSTVFSRTSSVRFWFSSSVYHGRNHDAARIKHWYGVPSSPSFFGGKEKGAY